MHQVSKMAPWVKAIAEQASLREPDLWTPSKEERTNSKALSSDLHTSSVTCVHPTLPSHTCDDDNKSYGWRDGSTFKNTGCSSRGPEFSSLTQTAAHNRPHRQFQVISCPFLAPTGARHAHHILTCIQIKHSYIQIKKIKIYCLKN